MKAVIIEDEYLAAEGLELMLKRYDATISVVARLDSVKTSVEWFNVNPAPDIAFFDIQLADGLSFEIFEQAKVSCPVIFTTAFNQYAIDAFKRFINNNKSASEDYKIRYYNFIKYGKSIVNFLTNKNKQSLNKSYLDLMSEEQSEVFNFGYFTRKLKQLLA